MPAGIYKRTKEMYLSRSGENHHSWKGDTVGYGALHDWIKKENGVASMCEKCGINKIPEGKKRWFEWSSKKKKPSRDKKNWWQLCVKCHREYDGWHLMHIGNTNWKKAKIGRCKQTGQFISLRTK